ncbi:hypothetical protein BURC_01697 [Burkholderiaceae bacterium]|nr:hypothetical protein BURC_01697 [Burkholderiaceae bacterium]
MNAKSAFAIVVAALVGGSALAIEATQLSALETIAPAKASEPRTECARAPLKRHDHGAERGLAPIAAKPMSMMPCDMNRGGSRADDKTDKVLRHDHGKFHKNQ